MCLWVVRFCKIAAKPVNENSVRQSRAQPSKPVSRLKKSRSVFLRVRPLRRLSKFRPKTRSRWRRLFDITKISIFQCQSMKRRLTMWFWGQAQIIHKWPRCFWHRQLRNMPKREWKVLKPLALIWLRPSQMLLRCRVLWRLQESRMLAWLLIMVKIRRIWR